MGTNYYIKTNKCKECGHEPEGIHLGKSSAGWEFSFQYNGGIYYKNVDEMKVWLRDKKIKDEYGGKVSYDDFWKMVEEKRGGRNHAGTVEDNYSFNLEGYSFTDREFC